MSITDCDSLVEAREFAQDEGYRAALAIGLKAEFKAEFAGVPTEVLAGNLKTVMGANELRHVLANELQPENFLHGNDYENVINGTYRANLHMHSVHSDGELTVEELLEQVVTYARYRQSLGKTDTVIIGLTDHDTLSGAREAVKLIAFNPEKYSDIRFVAGIEFCTYMREGNERKPFEAPGYAINPFKTGDVAKFVEGIQVKNAVYLEQIIRKGPDKEGQHGFPDEEIGGLWQWEARAGIPERQRTSIDEIKSHAKLLQSLGSPGFMPGLKLALLRTFEKRGWNYHPQDTENEINIVFQRHRANYGSKNINPGTPEIIDITAAVNASGCGFVGISHPCRDFKGYDLRGLFSQFKDMGVQAVEANYVYKPADGVSDDFIELASLAAEQTGLLKTGGNDNHSKSIFGGRGDEDKYLPEAVKDILTVIRHKAENLLT